MSPSYPDSAPSVADRAAIDAAGRGPVIAFIVSSVVWLIVGSLLGLLTSFKFHKPDLMVSFPFETLGRVRPAHLNVVNFGWMSMAGIGVALWLMGRLGRASLVYPRLLTLACWLWNVGVVVGAAGILAGHGTSVEWLEFPNYAPPFFIAALGIVSACTWATFRQRRESHVYVTQWYILAALFWMPWLYTVANLMIHWMPATGVVQATVNWWFAHNVLGLWLTPIGVGAAYYFIPKVLGRPIHSYHLSLIGFWSLALFYSWAGMHHMIGGPLPAWLVTASTVGSMMMFIPVIAVAINHHMTMRGHFHELRYSPTLRFVVFGAMSYTVVSFQGSIQALKLFNQTTHFTHYTIAHAHLGVYGFFSMVMFGSIYYVLPRLTGRQWRSTWLIRLHFWSVAIGILVYVISLTIAGWYQGRMLNDANVRFAEIVEYTKPFLKGRSVGGALMLLGHLAFASNVALNVFGAGKSRPMKSAV